jgi:hypothetical protein
MARRRALTAALALGATLATLALSAGGAAAAKPVFGVVPQDGAVPSESDLRLMPEGGISSIRLLLHWGSVEPVPGTYNWGGIDAMVRETTNRGIQPLFFFYGTPDWAAAQDKRRCSECSVYPPKTGRTRGAFSDFVRAAVQRYGPDGAFWKVPNPLRDQTEAAAGLLGPVCGLPPLLPECPDEPDDPNDPVPPPPTEPPPPPPTTEPGPNEAPCGCTVASPIRIWQVWNEQNSPKYFAPKVDVRDYAKLVKSTSKAIKSVDPGAEVMLGGMWGPANASKVVLPLRPYLKELYKVKGIKKHFDSIGLHPYAASTEPSLAQLEVTRQTVRKAGDRKVGIWITELGWAADGPKSNPYVKGLQGQAKLLRKTLGAFERKRKKFNLKGMYWYSWRDKEGGDLICDWCGHAGLRALDGSAKPAWGAFAKVAR